MVDLVPVVGHKEGGAIKLVQDLHKLQLHLPLEIAVQGGEGLVQQECLGLAGQDAGQGHPLLLSAGERGRGAAAPGR